MIKDSIYCGYHTGLLNQIESYTVKHSNEKD